MQENIPITPNSERRIGQVPTIAVVGVKHPRDSELVFEQAKDLSLFDSKVASFTTSPTSVPTPLLPKERSLREKMHEDLLARYFQHLRDFETKDYVQ